jgi:hypothetical protein
MTAMMALFTSGRVVDLILTIMAIEAIVLLTYRMATGRGIPPAGLVTNLIAGALLLLALRTALTGSPWTLTAAWLGGALLAHIADLAQRWRNQI